MGSSYGSSDVLEVRISDNYKHTFYKNKARLSDKKRVKAIIMDLKRYGVFDGLKDVKLDDLWW